MKPGDFKFFSRFLLYGVVGLCLQACNKSFHDLGAPPQLTSIGHEVPIHDILVAPDPEIITSPDRLQMSDNSILNPENVSYFQDTRAYKVGDILTVDIFINDSARLNNSSGRGTSVDVRWEPRRTFHCPSLERLTTLTSMVPWEWDCRSIGKARLTAPSGLISKLQRQLWHLRQMAICISSAVRKCG